MDKYDIHIDDFRRILFGMATPGYLLETVLRIALLYIIILIAIRIMGKRMTARLGKNELAARVALGAAVGMAMVRPGRGILLSVVIVIVILFVGKLLSNRLYYNRKLETAFQGKAALLAYNGMLNLSQLKKNHLSKERVFAALRQEGIRHLGEVKKFYIEANGEFSLLKNIPPKPGLAVIPDWDTALRDRMVKMDSRFCTACGAPNATAADHCQCGSTRYEKGVYSDAILTQS